jgi:hypothetical protein
MASIPRINLMRRPNFVPLVKSSPAHAYRAFVLDR